MRNAVNVLAFLAMIGLAFWAYRENYTTQDVISETEQLQRDIGAARERLAVLRAEWAYLNRPDRLSDLVDLNFETLQLMPFSADQFGRVDQIAYPVPDRVEITEPIELSSDGENP